MKRYRIIKREINELFPENDYKHWVNHKVTLYVAQKRFLGFLWWYNFNNIDGVVTGEYNTIEEARQAIERDRMGCKWNEEVVEEIE